MNYKMTEGFKQALVEGWPPGVESPLKKPKKRDKDGYWKVRYDSIVFDTTVRPFCLRFFWQHHEIAWLETPAHFCLGDSLTVTELEGTFKFTISKS